MTDLYDLAHQSVLTRAEGLPEDVRQLAGAVQRAAALFDNPQPGLLTWWQAVHVELRTINRLYRKGGGY